MLKNAQPEMERMEFHVLQLGAQELRYGIRRGASGSTPLLLFNGVGAHIELLMPFIDQLEDVEVIMFDVPGTGGSPPPLLPYRLRKMALLAAGLLDHLGYRTVDAMGISWGGALAQQFSHTCRRRCRRLVLAATSAGAVMVPGSPLVTSKLISPRRYFDSEYLQRIGGDIYGGVYRENPQLLERHGEHLRGPAGRGYAYQLLALAGWTSAWWLPTLKQPTLVLSGGDDPIVPPVNGHILASLIPRARLEILPCGHLFVVSLAGETARLVRDFLKEDV
jgi:poly(3-hydroxyalkanoate) depolymerase